MSEAKPNLIKSKTVGYPKIHDYCFIFTIEIYSIY